MSPKAPKVERIRARPTVIRRRRWKVVDSEEPSVIWKRLAKRNFEVLFWEAIDEIDEQRRKDAACFISKYAVRLITHIVLTIVLFVIICLLSFISTVLVLALVEELLSGHT